MIKIISDTWTKLEIIVALICLLFFTKKDKRKLSDKAACIMIDLMAYLDERGLREMSDLFESMIYFRKKDDNFS